MGKVRLALLGALVCAAVAASPATADVAGPDIVAFLNAQRAAQGVPAGIAEDSALTAGCAQHNAYGRLNGVLTHGEDPALAGFTPAGDQAGRTSVLYMGTGPWTSTVNPFENAPIHLHQLLAPRLDRMGASEDQGYGCATTLASRDRLAPAADVTYTYPGNGAQDWVPSQLAAESPYTPGELAGIPAGTTTGPYLYVMFDGPDLTPGESAAATSATLTGPDGPVDVAVVDNETPGLAGFLPPGMQVIPRAPLRVGAVYTATVAARVTTQGGAGPSRVFGRTWSFATGTLANAVRILQTVARGLVVDVVVSSAAPGAVVTATGPGTATSQPTGAGGFASLRLDRPGDWQICARAGGPPTSYAAAEDCVPVTVPAPAAAPRPSSAAAPGTAPAATGRPFTISVPRRVRHGRAIVLAVTSSAGFTLRFRVTTPGGRTIYRYPRHRLRGERTWTFRVRVPARYDGRGSSVRLVLRFDPQGRPYTVTRRIRIA